MKYVFGFIPGHGGLDKNGHYVTAPNKMFTFPDGYQVHEGVINRKIVQITLELAKWDGLENQVINIVSEFEDVPLFERIERTKKLWHAFREQGKELLLFEVHCNASVNHNARGFEVFSSSRQNFSDNMAKVMIEELAKAFPESNNRGAKERDYAIIYKVPCFAILTEHFFFDNAKEVEFNLRGESLKNHALAYIRTMHRLNKLNP